MRRALLIALSLGIVAAKLVADFDDMRATHLELFDGTAASASVAICIAEYESEGWNQ